MPKEIFFIVLEQYIQLIVTKLTDEKKALAKANSLYYRSNHWRKL